MDGATHARLWMIAPFTLWHHKRCERLKQNAKAFSRSLLFFGRRVAIFNPRPIERIPQLFFINLRIHFSGSISARTDHTTAWQTC
jgi:hypothetical protein